MVHLVRARRGAVPAAGGARSGRGARRRAAADGAADGRLAPLALGRGDRALPLETAV